MTTTIMRDSQVGDAWIIEMCRRNPVQRIYNAEGKDTGVINTCPVRLSFTDTLFVARANQRDAPAGSPESFSVTLLFPPLMVSGMPLVDLQPFNDEYNRIAAAEFSSSWNGQYFGGLDNPWRDQGAKAGKYGGYTPGCWYLNAKSKFKPSVVDLRGTAITDPARVYPGVWAIVALNGYASGKGRPVKGPRFGLASVMVVGDDTRLGGGGVDPRMAFRGANVTPPATAPTQQFGMAAAAQMAAQPPPGVAGFYGPGNSYTPPTPAPVASWGYPPPQPPAPQPQSMDWLTPEQRRLLGL